MKTCPSFYLSTLTLALLACIPGARAQTSANLTVLHTFSALNFNTGTNADGDECFAGLVQGKDGNFYGVAEGGGTKNDGTFFKVTPAGAFQLLYDFNLVPTGGHPEGTLVQGTDGNFYGTTETGGDQGEGGGTVFQITPAGVLTTLYTFAAPEGGSPLGPLTLGRDGYFYGTTYNGGGDQNTSTIFKISSTGAFTPLHIFTPTDDNGENYDGANVSAGVVEGADGYFYGTADDGGAHGAGTVFRITSTGTFTKLHDFTGADGHTPTGTLVLGKDGNFYGTTYSEGKYSDGTVFKITPQGGFTKLHDFTGQAGITAPEGANPDAGLIQGSDGNFYGTTFSGGEFNTGSIFEITPAGVLTNLYSFTAGDSGANDDGAGPFGPLVQGKDGNFYGTTLQGGMNEEGTVFKLALLPVITSAPTATATVGKAFSYQITATRNPTSFGVQGLPKGLTVNTTTGVISGTPTAAGKLTLTLNAYNGGGKGSASLTLTIQGPPVITSAATATATEGQAFSYQITASNSPTAYGVQGLPTGLTVNTKTGLISGTVSGAGQVSLTLNAYNAVGKGSATLTLTIKAAPPVITSATTASATAGQAFSYQITASNQPTEFGVQGLPSGLTVNTKTGLISGTAGGVGTVSLTLNAYNAAGKGSATLTLTTK